MYVYAAIPSRSMRGLYKAGCTLLSRFNNARQTPQLSQRRSVSYDEALEDRHKALRDVIYASSSGAVHHSCHHPARRRTVQSVVPMASPSMSPIAICCAVRPNIELVAKCLCREASFARGKPFATTTALTAQPTRKTRMATTLVAAPVSFHATITNVTATALARRTIKRRCTLPNDLLNLSRIGCSPRFNMAAL